MRRSFCCGSWRLTVLYGPEFASMAVFSKGALVLKSSRRVEEIKDASWAQKIATFYDVYRRKQVSRIIAGGQTKSKGF
jgi:hypothetical protein